MPKSSKVIYLGCVTRPLTKKDIAERRIYIDLYFGEERACGEGVFEMTIPKRRDSKKKRKGENYGYKEKAKGSC